MKLYARLLAYSQVEMLKAFKVVDELKASYTIKAMKLTDATATPHMRMVAGALVAAVNSHQFIDSVLSKAEQPKELINNSRLADIASEVMEGAAFPLSAQFFNRRTGNRSKKTRSKWRGQNSEK